MLAENIADEKKYLFILAATAMIKKTLRMHDKVKITKASTNYKFYNSWKWRKYSKRRIRNNPLCNCEKCRDSDFPNTADMTDHIIPVESGGSKWDPRNHESSTRLKCHQRKRQRESKGIIEPFILNSDGEKIPTRNAGGGMGV